MAFQLVPHMRETINHLPVFDFGCYCCHAYPFGSIRKAIMALCCDRTSTPRSLMQALHKKTRWLSFGRELTIPLLALLNHISVTCSLPILTTKVYLSPALK